jgi:hypothetical protein
VLQPQPWLRFHRHILVQDRLLKDHETIANATHRLQKLRLHTTMRLLHPIDGDSNLIDRAIGTIELLGIPHQSLTSLATHLPTNPLHHLLRTERFSEDGHRQITTSLTDDLALSYPPLPKPIPGFLLQGTASIDLNQSQRAVHRMSSIA